MLNALTKTLAFLPTLSIHRLLHRLPGYQILFAPYAFIPQRQLKIRKKALAFDILFNFFRFKPYIKNSKIFFLTLIALKTLYGINKI